MTTSQEFWANFNYLVDFCQGINKTWEENGMKELEKLFKKDRDNQFHTGIPAKMEEDKYQSAYAIVMQLSDIVNEGLSESLFFSIRNFLVATLKPNTDPNTPNRRSIIFNILFLNLSNTVLEYDAVNRTFFTVDIVTKERVEISVDATTGDIIQGACPLDNSLVGLWSNSISRENNYICTEIVNSFDSYLPKLLANMRTRDAKKFKVLNTLITFSGEAKALAGLMYILQQRIYDLQLEESVENLNLLLDQLIKIKWSLSLVLATLKNVVNGLIEMGWLSAMNKSSILNCQAEKDAFLALMQDFHSLKKVSNADREKHKEELKKELEILIGKQENVLDTCDDNGFTILHHAVLLGDRDAVQLLLDAQATINLRTALGYTTVSLLTQRNHLCISELANTVSLSYEASVAKDNGYHLYEAIGKATHQDLEKIRAFLPPKYMDAALELQLTTLAESMQRTIIVINSNVDVVNQYWVSGDTFPIILFFSDDGYYHALKNRAYASVEDILREFDNAPDTRRRTLIIANIFIEHFKRLAFNETNSNAYRGWSLYNIGLIYERGWGVKQSFEEAKAYYLDAIRLEIPYESALINLWNLSKIYLIGEDDKLELYTIIDGLINPNNSILKIIKQKVTQELGCSMSLQAPPSFHMQKMATIGGPYDKMQYASFLRQCGNQHWRFWLKLAANRGYLPAKLEIIRYWLEKDAEYRKDYSKKEIRFMLYELSEGSYKHPIYFQYQYTSLPSDVRALQIEKREEIQQLLTKRMKPPIATPEPLRRMEDRARQMTKEELSKEFEIKLQACAPQEHDDEEELTRKGKSFNDLVSWKKRHIVLFQDFIENIIPKEYREYGTKFSNIFSEPCHEAKKNYIQIINTFHTAIKPYWFNIPDAEIISSHEQLYAKFLIDNNSIKDLCTFLESILELINKENAYTQSIMNLLNYTRDTYSQFIGMLKNNPDMRNGTNYYDYFFAIAGILQKVNTFLYKVKKFPILIRDGINKKIASDPGKILEGIKEAAEQAESEEEAKSAENLLNRVKGAFLEIDLLDPVTYLLMAATETAVNDAEERTTEKVSTQEENEALIYSLQETIRTLKEQLTILEGKKENKSEDENIQILPEEDDKPIAQSTKDYIFHLRDAIIQLQAKIAIQQKKDDENNCVVLEPNSAKLSVSQLLNAVLPPLRSSPIYSQSSSTYRRQLNQLSDVFTTKSIADTANPDKVLLCINYNCIKEKKLLLQIALQSMMESNEYMEGSKKSRREGTKDSWQEIITHLGFNSIKAAQAEAEAAWEMLISGQSFMIPSYRQITQISDIFEIKEKMNGNTDERTIMVNYSKLNDEQTHKLQEVLHDITNSGDYINESIIFADNEGEGRGNILSLDFYVEETATLEIRAAWEKLMDSQAAAVQSYP